MKALPDSHPANSELKALTRQFEHIWYGNANADATEFSAALRHLEVLGCR